MSVKTARLRRVSSPDIELTESLQKNWLFNFKIKRPFYFNPKHREFYNCIKNPKTKMGFVDGPAGSMKTYIAVYAGLHGLAQGLDQILLAAQVLQDNKLDLQIIFVGEGLEKKKMIYLSKSLNLKNVTFVEPQEKQLMPAIWASADIALICLKKYILGAVPSKLYEAMASSTPIIMIGAGEPKKIVESANCGYTIEPGQINSIASYISNLVKDEKYRELASNNARNYVVEKFNRKRIMKNLLGELIKNENS